MRVNNTIYLVLFLASSLFAQEEQKNFLVGGDFNISYFKQVDPNGFQLNSQPVDSHVESKTLSYNFQINIGKILNDKSAIGIFGSYGKWDQDDLLYLANGDLFESFANGDEEYNLGIFYRREIISLAQVNFFLQPMLSYINEDEKTEILSDFINYRKYSNRGLDFSIDTGIRLTVDNKWNFLIRVPVLQYTYTTEDQLFKFTTNDQITKGNIHDINLDVNLRNIRIGVERLF